MIKNTNYEISKVTHIKFCQKNNNLNQKKLNFGEVFSNKHLQYPYSLPNNQDAISLLPKLSIVLLLEQP